MSNYNPDLHPRELTLHRGRFAEKTNSGPEVGFADTLSPIEAFGLPEAGVSNPHYDITAQEYDQLRELPRTFTLYDLPDAQRETARLVADVLDERRGIPAWGDSHDYEFDGYPDGDGLTAVYLWSKPAADPTRQVMRVVLDDDGDVHQLHYGVKNEYGIAWEDLSTR